MAGFVGRQRQLASLRKQWERVLAVAPGNRPGRSVLVRGRRQIGKSRLVEEFCEQVAAPYLFFTASEQRGGELELLVEEVADSNLPGRDHFAGLSLQNWDAAFRQLAASIPDDSPTVVVLDEFPYLVEGDPSIKATLQKNWDRFLSKKPVLLVVIGSDQDAMENLSTHGQPFFLRATEMVVPPLSPAETAKIVGSESAADAFDAFMITGGLPMVCDEWPSGISMWEYLTEALHEPTSALIVAGERTLADEFSTELQSRQVLTTIGAGERTFTNISKAAGIQSTPLTRSLSILERKRIISRDLPLSTARHSKDARYRISDPYLRFWLQFVRPHLAEVQRGRSDRVVTRIEAGWASWRGRTIEPVVREALSRLGSPAGLPHVDVVGGFWTRTNRPEIDVVALDRSSGTKTIVYAGTVKWRETELLEQSDLNTLAADVLKMPGGQADTPLVAISRTGVSAKGAAATYGPDELIDAW